MDNFKIAVNLFYRPVEQLKDILIKNKDILIPVNGGSSLVDDKWVKENVHMDNSGDNISSHNKLINEMTTIYWIWKNFESIGNPEYIGFNHYRRFFRFEELRNSDGQFDIMVAKPVFSSNRITIARQYSYYHVINDLFKCFDVLDQLHPKFSWMFYSYVNSTGVNFAPCNMFLMKRELFFEWCEFIFPVIFALEKVLDLSNRDNYQRRAICFLVERLFGAWCYFKRSEGRSVIEVDMDEFLDFKPKHINERGDFS